MLSPPVSRDLVVVGAGIVGASVAYHAARAGAVVILVDVGRPGAGVTADSFAWIGASGVRTGPAAGLRVTATEDRLPRAKPMLSLGRLPGRVWRLC